jgi:cytochrome P450
MALPLPPIHQSGLRFGGLREFISNRVEFATGTSSSGRTVRLQVGPPGLRNTLYLMHSAEGAEMVFSAKTWSNFRKENSLYNEFRQVIGNGLLTAQDEDWLRQKRFVQPVFTKARVDGYLEMMLDEVEALAETWRAADEVELSTAMTHLTLRIVGRVLFGDGLDELESTISTEFPIAQRGILKRAAFGGKIPLSWPIAINTELRASQAKLYEVVDRIINERRASGERSDDLISLLLDARDGDEQLSNDEVRDQILIFLLAGHETTSSALTFALHLIGRHPDIQQGIRDEVAAVVGDARPTPSQLHSGLPFTTAVLKEAMRMYPSAPFVGRRLSEASEVDGYSIPAGADAVVSIWSIHHDPELWPDPDTFDPKRFMEGDPANRYAWMPFGAGPRACIGQHFSMMESVAALAVLIRTFDIESLADSDRVPVNSAITLFPLEPVPVRLRSAAGDPRS